MTKRPQPGPGDKDFAKAQEEFNKFAQIVRADYAAASLIARDLSCLYLEGRFDEMLEGLQKLTADTSPGSMGKMALGQLTRGISDGWLPLAEDRFPIDGPKRDALRRDFAKWLADDDKSPATALLLLEDVVERLERSLYRCDGVEKETLFTLVKTTGAPLLDRKLASAGADLVAARQYPDQEIVSEGGSVEAIIPGGRLAAAQRRADNLTALKAEYDSQNPPVPKKPGSGPKP